MNVEPGRVSLREVTGKTVIAITRLAVDKSQDGFVAPNAISFAQALFAPEAWYRAIYLDDTPVGFVMLEDQTLSVPPPADPRISLWRYMIDARYQRQGIGRVAPRPGHRRSPSPQALHQSRDVLRPRPRLPRAFLSRPRLSPRRPARRPRGRARAAAGRAGALGTGDRMDALGAIHSRRPIRRYPRLRRRATVRQLPAQAGDPLVRANVKPRPSGTVAR